VIIDANAFIGKWPYWPLRATAPGEVVAELAGWGIERAAISSTRGVFVSQDDGNAETEAAARAESALIPFLCAGPSELSHTLERQPPELAHWARRGFRGVRLYPQHHSYHPLYEPELASIVEQAEALGWPVLLPLRILMNWGMPALDLEVIRSVVEKFPRAIWILAGINYLWEMQLAVSLMRRFDGVHVETSCMMGFAAIEKLVQQCDARRILFGSGAPLAHGGAGVEKVRHARIRDADREAILGGNAQRLLWLET
jgi:uncharacterized protein